MLALVAAVLLAQAPDPAAPDFAGCNTSIEQGDLDAARACYAAHSADADAERAELARELADIVGSLQLPEPAAELTPPRPAPFDVALLATTGKAELIVVTALAGGYVADLALLTLMLATNGMGLGSAVMAGLLVAPVAGGAAGLAGGTALVLGVPELTAGDANVLRAFLLLGGFNSVMAPLSMVSLSMPNNNGAILSATMLAAVGTAAAAGAAVAAITDVPEGAGSMAVSGALWTPLLTVLTINMFEGFKTDSRGAFPVVALAGNLGFAGALVLGSTVLPLSRVDTWALDIGGAVGVLGGAALALGLPAPNPFLGYGTMAAGCVVGLGAGVAAARLVPAAVEAMPTFVALSPLVVPALGPAEAPVGVALAGRF